MPKVLHVSGYVVVDGGRSMQPELMERIISKVMAMMARLGCTFWADWRIGDPPEVEDILG